MLIGACGAAFAADVSEIERRRLFNPIKAELRAEADGRIYIYDGLRDIDCVFRTKSATDSIAKLPPIPRQACH